VPRTRPGSRVSAAGGAGGGLKSNCGLSSGDEDGRNRIGGRADRGEPSME